MAYHHKQSVDNSMGRNHADLVLQGGKIVDVHSGLIREGDIIVTGTPGGVGRVRKPPIWMKPGDTVEIDVRGLGTLSNSIVDEPTG